MTFQTVVDCFDTGTYIDTWLRLQSRFVRTSVFLFHDDNVRLRPHKIMTLTDKTATDRKVSELS